MAWSGQTWLEILQEGTGGSGYGSAGAGASIYPTLYSDNAFTVRKVPQRQVIRTADAGNRPKFVVANRMVYQGTLTTLAHPDQMAYWLTAASTLTNDGNGHPWLPSYTAKFWDSTQAWQFVGGMLQSLTVSSSAQQDYNTVSMNWIFQQGTSGGTFAQPAETVYSSLPPYSHVDTASHCTLGGTAFTKYKSINFTIANVLAGTWDELPYISACYYSGRDFSFDFGPQYLATAYRGDYEGQTELAFVLDWAVSGHGMSINLNSRSVISSISDELPLNGPGYQQVSVQALFDSLATTPGDFKVTVS